MTNILPPLDNSWSKPMDDVSETVKWCREKSGTILLEGESVELSGIADTLESLAAENKTLTVPGESNELTDELRRLAACFRDFDYTHAHFASCVMDTAANRLEHLATENKTLRTLYDDAMANYSETVDGLVHDIAQLRAALEHYADSDNWGGISDGYYQCWWKRHGKDFREDGWTIARTALGKGE